MRDQAKDERGCIMQRLILITEFFSPSELATAQLMDDLHKGLSAKGWPITVVTSTGTNNGLERGVVRLGCDKNNKGKSAAMKAIFGIVFCIRAFFFCLMNARKKDILLIASNPPFSGLIGAAVKITRGCSFVFIYQDLFPKSAVISKMIPEGGFTEKACEYIMQVIYRTASCIVVLNEDMKSTIFKQIDCTRSPNIVKIENWALEEEASEAEYYKERLRQTSKGRLKIQYSGNFGRLHDFSTILNAAALVQEQVEFRFIGKGYREREIYNSIRQYSLKNIKVSVPQPRKDLVQSLADCDMAVVSLIEGAERVVAPSKLYGILASGRAVIIIAVKECETSRIVINARCGIVVKPGSFEKLAQRLIYLYQNKGLVMEMGKNARRLYEASYGKKRSIDLYHEMLWSLK